MPASYCLDQGCTILWSPTGQMQTVGLLPAWMTYLQWQSSSLLLWLLMILHWHSSEIQGVNATAQKSRGVNATTLAPSPPLLPILIAGSDWRCQIWWWAGWEGGGCSNDSSIQPLGSGAANGAAPAAVLISTTDLKLNYLWVSCAHGLPVGHPWSRLNYEIREMDGNISGPSWAYPTYYPSHYWPIGMSPYSFPYWLPS